MRRSTKPIDLRCWVCHESLSESSSRHRIKAPSDEHGDYPRGTGAIVCGGCKDEERARRREKASSE